MNCTSPDFICRGITVSSLSRLYHQGLGISGVTVFCSFIVPPFCPRNPKFDSIPLYPVFHSSWAPVYLRELPQLISELKMQPFKVALSFFSSLCLFQLCVTGVLLCTDKTMQNALMSWMENLQSSRFCWTTAPVTLDYWPC